MMGAVWSKLTGNKEILKKKKLHYEYRQIFTFHIFGLKCGLIYRYLYKRQLRKNCSHPIALHCYYVIQSDQINMAVLLLYFVKSEASAQQKYSSGTEAYTGQVTF